MSAKIETNDRGILSGDYTWHGLEQYRLVGDRPVTLDEAATVAPWEAKKVPTFIANNQPTGVMQSSETT